MDRCDPPKTYKPYINNSDTGVAIVLPSDKVATVALNPLTEGYAHALTLSHVFVTQLIK